VLPALPPLVLVLGWYLVRVGTSGTAVRVLTALTGVILLAGAVLVHGYKGGDRVIPHEQLATLAFLLQGGLALGGLLMLISSWRWRMIPVATGLMLILMMPALTGLGPALVQYKRIGYLLHQLPQPLPAQVTVIHLKSYDQALNFYTGHRVVLVDQLGELDFGSHQGDQSLWFLQGKESVRRLAREGPVLVAVWPPMWDEIKDWPEFQVVAAQTANYLIANQAFFRLTGLTPWPKELIQPKVPLLLLPSRGIRPAAPGSSGERTLPPSAR